MKLKKILIGLEGLKAKGSLDVDVKHLDSDSKNIKEGDMFVAIKGFSVDGHKYINDAIKRLENGEPVQYVVGNVDFYGYVLNLRKKTIIEKLCLSNTDNFIIKDDIFTLVNILKIYKNNCSKNEIKYIENAQKNYNENDESYNSIWNSVERFWRCCIEQNRVTSIENNPDKIIAVLKSYSDLRDVRNKLNHANFTNVSNETSEELEKEVINVLNVCVKSIEDIIKSK